MAISKTQLFLRLTPINPSLDGTPQEFAEELVSHLEIVAPFGISTFVTGSQMPLSNQGPWLKDGQEWWVWDDIEKTYVPLVLGQSLPTLFYVQEAEPPTDGATIWFKLGGGNADEPGGLYLLVAGKWKAVTGVPSGGTAERPANPAPFQQFYDSDIEALIWYERGAWRTVDGVRGDVKYVAWETQAEALLHNPGWEILWAGAAGDVESKRGCFLGPAMKDAGGGNPISVGGAVTAHEAGEVTGNKVQNVPLTIDNLPRHDHEIGVGNTGSIGIDHRVGDLYDAASGRRLANSGAVLQYIDSLPQVPKVGLTMFTGKPTPDPVAVPMEIPTVWMFLLRKA